MFLIKRTHLAKQERYPSFLLYNKTKIIMHPFNCFAHHPFKELLYETLSCFLMSCFLCLVSCFLVSRVLRLPALPVPEFLLYVWSPALPCVLQPRLSPGGSYRVVLGWSPCREPTFLWFLCFPPKGIKFLLHRRRHVGPLSLSLWLQQSWQNVTSKTF